MTRLQTHQNFPSLLSLSYCAFHLATFCKEVSAFSQDLGSHWLTGYPEPPRLQQTDVLVFSCFSQQQVLIQVLFDYSFNTTHHLKDVSRWTTNADKTKNSLNPLPQWFSWVGETMSWCMSRGWVFHHRYRQLLVCNKWHPLSNWCDRKIHCSVLTFLTFLQSQLVGVHSHFTLKVQKCLSSENYFQGHHKLALLSLKRESWAQLTQVVVS